MKIITTVMSTVAEFSEDGKKRYLLTKTWDKEKPHLVVIMLAPSEASGIELDNSTMLVLNNASRLGYGSVSIVNLFSIIGNLKECFSEEDDKENLKYINNTAQRADVIVYASGVGKATNKAFIRRQEQVLSVLKPYEKKLKCLSGKDGNARFQHPLSPAVRTWYLSEMNVSELLSEKPSEQKEDISVKKSKRKLSSSLIQRWGELSFGT